MKRDLGYNSEVDYEKISKAFEETDAAVIGEVGNAQCKLFNMKPGFDFQRSGCKVIYLTVLISDQQKVSEQKYATNKILQAFLRMEVL